MKRCEVCGVENDDGRCFDSFAKGEFKDVARALLCRPCAADHLKHLDPAHPEYAALASRIRANRRQSPAPVDADGATHISAEGRTIHVGDNVIWDKDRGNGETGTVSRLDFEEGELAVWCENWSDGQPGFVPAGSLRHSPPPEVKPSERGNDMVDSIAYAMASLKPSGRAREEKLCMAGCGREATEDMLESSAPGCRLRLCDPCNRHRILTSQSMVRPIYKPMWRYFVGIDWASGSPELACYRIGLSCALIEAMRRDFAILHALRPGMTAGDLRAALGEPPL